MYLPMILALLLLPMALTDISVHPSFEYYKFYTPQNLDVSRRISTSSMMRLGVICSARSICRGYRFRKDICELYGEELDEVALYSTLNSTGISIWSRRYAGCWKDTFDRDLEIYVVMTGTLTLEQCISYCQVRGYKIVGLQYHRGCTCGNNYGRYGKSLETDCNTPCDGDATTMCGGALRNSIYRI